MALKNPPSWLQNGSHPAVNDRLTQQALFNTTGIIGTASLAVTGTSGLGLSVASGWAAIQANAGSGLGVYTIYNDAANALTISAYAVTNPRIDKVVATVSDSAIPYGSGDTVAFAIVTGTEAVSPTAPATPSNSIALATVLVPVGSGAITITDARTFITSNAFLPLGGGTVSGATTFSGAVTANGGVTTGSASKLTLGAGSASVAPLQFTTGTNLTAPVAGSVEFDGSAVYFTPGFPTTTSGRGSIAAPFYYSLGSATSQQNVLTAQPLFPGMTNGLQLQANTLYEFEVVAGITVANTTSRTATLTLGGTATFNLYAHDLAYTQSAALSTAANSAMAFSNTSAVTTSALVNVTYSFVWKGQIRTNAAGYLLPQLTYGTALPVTSSLAAGSYIKVTPVFGGVANGTAIQSVGAWS